MNNKKLDQYYDIVVAHSLYSKKSHLQFKTRHLFQGNSLSGKNLLDIGGGDGLFSFYAACSNAKLVTCLEPESDGSFGNMNNNFELIRRALNLDNIFLERVSFQDFKDNSAQYDIILLHNSVNHLDEEACVALTDEEYAYKKYIELFKKIYSIAKKNSILILCDCSKYNFFASLKVKNIFAPTIEWHKHQAPETWIKLLEEVGYSNPKLSWTSPKQLGEIGRILTGNKFVSYFIGSHFRLEMIKV